MRIVSLIPSATEIAAALGLTDRLVGITHSCDHPPDVTHLPRVTSTTIPKGAASGEIDRAVKESVAKGSPLYELDVELLDRLAPDLIVTQGVCDVCAVGETQTVACLSGLGTRPEILSLHPHRFDDVLDDVVRVGRAVGVEDRARELVAGYRDRLEAVRRRLAGRLPVSTVVLEWIDPLFSCGHWTPEVVAAAGGRELLAGPGDRSRELRWEEVVVADPDVIVLACCGQDVERAIHDLAHLEALPGFSHLTAVGSGRVYAADGGAYFSRPGPRLVDAVEMLAATLHGGEAGQGLVPVLGEGASASR